MAVEVQDDVYNLSDLYLNRDRTERIKKTSKSFIDAGSVMQDIKIKTDARIEVRGREWTTVSRPTFRKLNQPPGTFKQTPRDWSATTYQYADRLDVPKRILEAEEAEGRDPQKLIEEQVDQYYEGVAFDLNFRFFRNRHTGAAGDDLEPECFLGLIPLLRNPTEYRVAAECNISAGGLDLSPSGITTTTAAAFFRYFQKGVYSVKGGENGMNVTAFASEDLIMGIEQGLRLGGNTGGWRTTEDGFGRHIVKYRDVTIRPAGRRAPSADGAQAQNLASTELQDGTADTGGACTSLVFVKSSEADLYMTQAHDPEPGDPFELENGVDMRVVCENAHGIVRKHNRCIARVYGLKIA